MGTSAGTGTGDDLIGTNAVDIAAGHAHATGEVGFVGKEAAHGGQRAIASTAESFDMGTSAGTGTGDDLIGTDAVDIAAGHAYTTAEVGVVGKEAGDLLGGGLATIELQCKGFDMGPATGAGAGDDVEDAIAIHIAGSHAHTAIKARVVGKETGDHIAIFAVKHFDVGTTTGAGGRHDVLHTVAIEIAIGDRNAALKEWKCRELLPHGARGIPDLE